MKKSKIFARKIVATVLAVIMAVSTFTSVVTAYAKSTDDAHDQNLAANFMTWAETTDNQTCEALLDWIDDTLGKAGIAPLSLHMDYVVIKIDIEGYIDSVDGLLDLVGQVWKLVNQYKNTLGGDIKNIYLNPIGEDLKYSTDQAYVVSKCGKSYRAVNDAKAIVMALAETIYWNANDDTSSKRKNNNVIGQFIKGQLNLGSILSGIVDVYSIIGGIGGLNMWSGYQSNLVYNILAQVILTKTNWFTQQEVANFQSYLQGKGGTAWNFDEQLLAKLTSEFMNKISVEMTYALEKGTDEEGNTVFNPTDSSKTRYTKIKAWLEERNLSPTDANIIQASNALGYDPNLRYDKNGNGMIYLFRYGVNGTTEEEALSITVDSTFYDIVDEALKLVWKTTLKPTIRTMRVNNSMDWYEGHGGNFDNNYYYWLAGEGLVDEENWENNYTWEKFNLYAAANYAAYNCADAEEFTQKVRRTFEYERGVVDDPQYNWRDVSKSNDYNTPEGRRESILFGKLRYSPLADKLFNMQTGPINLYIMQTGFPNLSTFMDNYVDGKTDYANVPAALNDALVAAVKDLFPDSANIGLGTNNEVTTNLVRPELTLTGASTTTLNTAKTLVSNACKIFEYAANAADANILNGFYHNHGITDKTTSANLSEANFEEAMIPLLVSCIKIIAGTRSIHDSDFDMAKDAEGVAYVVLREYLSFSLPSKDYDQLVTTANGTYEANIDVDGNGTKDLYGDVILTMARDAVGYLLNSVVPCRTKSGAVWNVYESNPATDKTTLFELLNSVVCYYASTEEFPEPSYNSISSKTYGKGVAALLGVVDANGNCLVKMSNSLWDNITVIANKVWPTIGVLQFGSEAYAGQANAETLIYDTIIKSILNISEDHTITNARGTTTQKGITTVIYQLLTIFTADPIMNKGIDVLVYDDVLASLVNSVFGAKLTNQLYPHVLPTSSEMGGTHTPFDSMVSSTYFANYKGNGSNATGILGILVSNIFCAFGGNANVQNATRGNGCWQGAMFAVKAVSYFVNGFLPQLRDHKFGAASVSVDDPSRSDYANGKAIDGYLTIKNESVGLNRFYKEGNSIKYDDRYFIEVTGLTSSSSTVRIDSPTGTVIAPEKSIKVKLNGAYPSTAETVKFTLTYNIYKGTSSNQKKELKYQNQIATCYLNFSPDKGWLGSLDSNDSDSGAKYSSTSMVDPIGTSGQIYTDIVLSSTNPEQVSSIGVSLPDLNGVYAADTNGDAYVTYNVVKKSGIEYINVVNKDKLDYRINTVDSNGNVTAEGAWNNGDSQDINGVTVYAGVTRDQVPTAAAGQSVDTRTHIAVSTETDTANDVIKTVERNSDDSVESVTVDPAVVAMGAATAKTPIDGINFVPFAGSAATYNVFLKTADQVTSVAAGNYEFNLFGYDTWGTTGIEVGTINVNVADTSGAASLQRYFESVQEQINPYQPSDYDDYQAASDSSNIYNSMQNKFANVIGQIAIAPSAENADQFAPVTVVAAQTAQVTGTTGDPAYMPATDITEAYAAEKGYVKNNSNGYYYLDEAYKYPVCSNVLVKGGNVTNGKDPLGRKVQLIGDTYYLVNEVEYVREWDETTYEYPYNALTSTPNQYETKDAQGNVVMKDYYLKELHAYYAANGMRVNASDNWAYTCALTYEKTKENDGTNDYRSIYAKLQDYLTYYKQETMKHIDTSAMAGITGPTGLIETRKGKENVNYDVATYEKMVQIAKEAEALVYKTGELDENGKDIWSTTATSAQLLEAVDQFKKYSALVVPRGYEGAKLEKELAFVTNTTKGNLVATFDEDAITHVISNGVVTFNSGTPKYGTLENGVLVNKDAEGNAIYSDVTWTNYVNALAKAISVAQAEEAENISGTYVAKKELVIAENNLAAPEVVTDYTVTGTITEAINGTGSAGTFALAGAKIYDGTKLLATANADGQFTVSLPIGVATTVTVKAANAVPRKVTFSAEATGVNIGIVAVDYNGDGKVNSTDIALGSKTTDIGTDIDSKITPDQFKSIARTGVAYSADLA